MRKYLQQIYSTNRGIVKIYPGLNGAKGLLILLVVITHCLPPSMALYFLYFFHMPLFMSISGFLLKQSAFQNGLLAYLKKIFHRLIIPWIIAWIIYLPFALNGRSVATLSIYDVIHPYYHLWYIPSYLIGALICFSIYKWKVPVSAMLIISALITISWYVIYRDKQDIQLPLYWLGDKRFYAYLFFFITGYCLRNGLFRFYPSPTWLFSGIALSLGLIVYFVFTHKADTLVAIPYIVFNFSLVLFVLLYVAPQQWLQNKALKYINDQSLAVYLYHPVIIYFILGFLKDQSRQSLNNFSGVGLGVLTMILVLIFTWIVKKWNVSDKYLFGNLKR
jgi:fucose 4-O-acetylase-like acetyltransferase